MKKFNIGDIVFVTNYQYNSGCKGEKHCFVLIDDGQAVELNYFGFLVSSRLQKSTYLYNEIIQKDNTNNLHKDSIVKCDDLIKISEDEIEFKIGEVSQNDLERFVNTYIKYIETN